MKENLSDYIARSKELDRLAAENRQKYNIEFSDLVNSLKLTTAQQNELRLFVISICRC